MFSPRSKTVKASTADEPALPPSLASEPSPLTSSSSKVGDHPDHRFQINHDLLYEREFEGGAFVSAHLQRLQNGLFAASNLHSTSPLHVTFIAITFTFHPVTSSGSNNHRFESTVIEIVAKSRGLPLKILKFAPHMAFGRISSSSLKWNFHLGATVGVTNSQAKASFTPSLDYERDTVVGTMMKMHVQGSTRSTQVPLKDSLVRSHSSKTLADTRIVWTLEENTQQKAGIPREFTFVFLVERTVPANSRSAHDRQKRSSRAATTHNPQVLTAKASASPQRKGSHANCDSKDIHVEQNMGLEIRSPQADFDFSFEIPGRKLTHTINHNMSIIDNLRVEAAKLTKKLHLHDSVTRAPHLKSICSLKSPHQTTPIAIPTEIFTDIEFNISVKPDIAGMNIPKGVFEQHTQSTTIKGQVGQKFMNRAKQDMIQGERLDEAL